DVCSSDLEVPDRRRGVPAPPHAGQRGHPRVVPAGHVSLGDERQQLALAGDRVVELEPGELDLLGQGAVEEAPLGQSLEYPVVERPMVLELERAQRMRDALEGILD